jgi:hypothetical protein
MGEVAGRYEEKRCSIDNNIGLVEIHSLAIIKKNTGKAGKASATPPLSVGWTE